MQNKFNVHSISWYAGAELINVVRIAACESGLIEESEKLIDNLDKSSRHSLAISTGGKLFGCARITTKGQIDRIVILQKKLADQVEAAMIEILSDYAELAGMEKVIVLKRIYFEAHPLQLAA